MYRSYRLYMNSLSHALVLCSCRSEPQRFIVYRRVVFPSCFHLFASVIWAINKQQQHHLTLNRNQLHSLSLCPSLFRTYLYFELWNSVPTSKHWKTRERKPSDGAFVPDAKSVQGNPFGPCRSSTHFCYAHQKVLPSDKLRFDFKLGAAHWTFRFRFWIEFSSSSYFHRTFGIGIWLACFYSWNNSKVCFESLFSIQ